MSLKGSLACLSPVMCLVLANTGHATPAADIVINTPEVAQRDVADDVAVTVTDTGSVTTTDPTRAAISVTVDNSSAFTFDGNVTNTTTTGEKSAIEFRRDYTGAFTNNATLSNTVTGGTARGSTLSFGNFSGSFNNTGLVSLNHSNNETGHDVFGAVASSGGTITSFQNSGQIRSSFTNMSGAHTAASVSLHGASEFTNAATGIISVALSNHGFGGNPPLAYGVTIRDGGTRFTNDGTISVEGTASSYARFEGVNLRAPDSIVNNGVVRVLANAGSDAPSDKRIDASGISSAGHISGAVRNTNLVEVVATGSDSVGHYALTRAYGIWVGLFGSLGSLELTDSSIVRSTATAGANSTSSADAEAIAIWLRGSVSGAASLAGEITASAKGGANATNSASANAIGVQFDSSVGSVTNAAVITATATAPEDNFASAYGIRFGSDFAGTLTHSGEITATAVSAAGISKAYGLSFGSLSGTLNITGDITATGADAAYAIFAKYGAGTINIENTARIEGLIHVADHDVNLTAVDGGGSYTYNFEDADTAAGTFTTIDNGLGSWTGSGEGTVNPTYAFVSGRGLGFKAGTQRFANLLQALGGLGSKVRSAFSGGGERFTVSTRGSDPTYRGNSAFVEFTGGRIKIADSATAQETETQAAGLRAGMLWQIDNGLALGVTAGGYDGKTTVANPTSLNLRNESNGAYLGMILASQFTNGSVLSFELRAGTSRNNQDRYITTGNGPEVASGSYNSNWVGAELIYTNPISVSPGVLITPKVAIRGGMVKGDGFTETGSSSNITYGSRKSNVIEGELGVIASRTYGSGTLFGELSVHGWNGSADDVDITVLGSSSTMQAGDTSNSAGRFGLGYVFNTGAGSTLNLNASTYFGGDGLSGEKASAIFEWTF